jgi:hypothetical protein
MYVHYFKIYAYQVGETYSGSSFWNRKFDELEESDESAHSYISIKIKSGDAMSVSLFF